AGLAAGARLRTPALRGRLLCAVVAVDAVVLFAAPQLSLPRHVVVDTKPAAFLSRHLGEGRFFTLGPLQPNYGSYFGLASANINDLPIPKLYSNYIHARLDQFVNPIVFVGNTGGGRSPYVPTTEQELVRNLDGYRALGVNYVLTPANQPLTQSPSSFQLAARTPTTRIYHLTGAAPYFTAPGCRVQSGDRQDVTLTCPHATALTRRETDLAGWTATIDNHQTPIREADGLFQATTIPAGIHRVTFSYAPPDILWAALAFVAGILALGATTISTTRARKPPLRR
ncbi:MAG: YfhO family protein, partial [Solirubrobacteraceae bacterium]